MTTNRTRAEAQADVRANGENQPVVVAGRWVPMPSGRQGFKVGVGFEIETVPNQFAYRGSVIPARRLVAFRDEMARQAHEESLRCEGGECQDINRLCSKHSWAYQRQFGRASNE